MGDYTMDSIRTFHGSKGDEVCEGAVGELQPSGIKSDVKRFPWQSDEEGVGSMEKMFRSE